MKNINALKQLRADKSKALSALLAEHMTAASAGEKPRHFTDAEKSAQQALRDDIAAHDALIAAAEEQIALDRNHVANGGESRIEPPAARLTGGDLVAKDDPRRGFKSHRDFLRSTMANAGLRDRAQVSDIRLKPLAVVDKDDKASGGEVAYILPKAFTPRSILAAAGSDEAGEYSDPHGGFAVPTSRVPGILQVGFEGDPTAGLTQPIPMQTPSVEIMSRVDKDHSTSVSGGFTVSRRPETGAAGASRAQLEMIGMKATSLFGIGYETEELLTDSPESFLAIIDQGFRLQFGAHMLNEKLRGKGGNEYLGVLTALYSATAGASLGPTLTVAAEASQTADTVNGWNLVNMAARCWGFDNAVWIANHQVKPQLYSAYIPVGTGGAMLFTPSREAGFPDQILGRPVFYSEFASALGDVGDIGLFNFSQFLEGIYSPLQSAESAHVRFLQHERTFKFWVRNCGAPWWRSPLTPNKGVTLSPFVVLAAR